MNKFAGILFYFLYIYIMKTVYPNTSSKYEVEKSIQKSVFVIQILQLLPSLPCNIFSLPYEL